MTTKSTEKIVMVAKFEFMSNELLMELFEYYDLYSLFFSFSSLNSRIDNLLHHCHVHVDLDRVQPIDFVRFLANILPQINPTNIRSLHATKSHQIMVLAYDESLTYFTHIRSLSLCNIQSNIVEYMVSRIHCSRLERVIFGDCEDEETKRWSFFQHFLNSGEYHFLRTYKDYDSTIGNLPSVLSIEYLTISSCTPYDFLNILNQSPYLKYVQTGLNFKNEYPESVFLSPTPCYHTLTHLHLYFESYGQVSMTLIDYLFQCVPRVYNLRLSGYLDCQPEYVDPIFWERFLSKYLVKLKRISMCASANSRDDSSSINPIWNYLRNKELIIEQIEKSNYWSFHQWKATFDSDIPRSPGGIYWAQFTVA